MTILLFLLPGPSGAIEANSLRDLPSPHINRISRPPSIVLLLGQSCTSPCSSDVPAPAGRGSSGVHDGAVACFCCCLVQCAAPTCSLDASRFRTGGWELGPARLNRSFFRLPPCSSVASQSAGRELGQGGIGPLLRPLSCPPLCVRSSRAARATPTAHKGVHHITSIYIYPSRCLPNMHQKCLANAHLFRLRAEQNSVEFYVFVFFVFLLCLGNLAFSTLFVSVNS